MRCGVIYTITNLNNGNQYVGRTTEDPEKYWRQHLSRAGRGYEKVLYDAIRKHGEDAFEFEVVERHSSNNLKELNKTLNRREMALIEELGTFGDGYNATMGGEGTLGVVRSEEFKEYMRELKTGVERPEWVIAKMRKPHTKEHIENLKGPKSEEHLRNLRKYHNSLTVEEKRANALKAAANRRSYSGKGNPFYGKKHSRETLDRIAEKNKELQSRPEVKLANKKNQPGRKPLYAVSIDRLRAIHFLTRTDAKRWIASTSEYKGDVGTISKAVELGRVSYGYYWVQCVEGVETIEKIQYFREGVLKNSVE